MRLCYDAPVNNIGVRASEHMATNNRETIVVTGISGNLGTRLLPLLVNDFDVVGIDMRPPDTQLPLRFESLDLGREAATDSLIEIIRETGATQVIHLAFVIDPQRTGVLDADRMWQINVAGTARVMEAIAVVNRNGGHVRKFIFPSSVSAYGPETPELVRENHPLGAHTLPYAIHKQECDEVVRLRADALGSCSTYILRPHIFTGATVQNYLVGALRGTPLGNGRWGERLRSEGRRLPLMLPFGDSNLGKQFQFVHVDDMARLFAHIARRSAAQKAELVILNVAGRGEPITIAECAKIGRQKLIRLPRWICRLVLRFLWNSGVSSIPPEALPYMIGSYTMNTDALKQFLGSDYDKVIQYTSAEALADSFREPAADATANEHPVATA